MNLKLSTVGIVAAMGLSLGSVACGPGLSHRTYSAQDVLEQMNQELAASIPGTATITSGTMELPEGRLPLTPSAAPEIPADAPQTWGAPRPIDTKSPYDSEPSEGAQER